MPEEPEPAPEPEPEPEEEPEPEPKEEEQGGNIGGLLIMLVLMGAIGGGAYYYFKVRKPKQGTKGASTSNLDDFVFDEDEEDMPDFTATPEPEEFSFEPADAESEDRQ